MIKKILGFNLLILSACSSSSEFDVKMVSSYDNSKIEIVKKDDNFLINKIKTSSFFKKVSYLNKYLERIKDKVNGYENFKIASVSTGISNFLNKMGVDLIAVSNSQSLDEEIKNGRKNLEQSDNKYYNLGNPLKPSLEVLKISKANIIFSNNSLLSAINYKEKPFYNTEVPAIFLPTKSFEDFYAILSTIGEKLGDKDKVKKLWEKFYNYQNNIKDLISKKSKNFPRSLFLMKTNSVFYVYGKKSSANSISKQLQLEFLNEKVEGDFSQLSKEEIIKLNPDFLIISIHNYSPELALKTKNEIFKLDWIKQTNAYKNNKIIITKDYSLIKHDSYDIVFEIAKKIYGV